MNPLRITVVALLVAGAAIPVHGAVLEEGLLHIEYDPADAATAQYSLEVLREAISEFSHRLSPGEKPIRLVIAHMHDQYMAYAKSFGPVRVSGLARSEEGLIVVKAPGLRYAREDYHGTLRHELVHVLLARNVNTDYLPRWLNEGLCMSLANEYYWNSLFHVARMFVGGRIIPYKDLDMRFRAPGDEMEFGDAYAQALSMTRFMRKEFGEDVFWAVILGTKDKLFARSLEAHAGVTVLGFWDVYHRSLWKIALIGSLGSGSIFGLPAVLLILAFIRKRFTNRRLLRQWAIEEAEDDNGIVSWDDVAEGPYEWEQDEEDDR